MKWNKKDIDYLTENYATLKSIKEISVFLNRSSRSIKHKAARLGLARLKIPHNKPKNPQYRKIIDKKYYEKNKKKIYKNKMQRRWKYKEELINIFGGKCTICGYNKCSSALEFHHNKGEKEKTIGELLKGASKQKVLKEANKCTLICANCHRELHHRLRS